LPDRLLDIACLQDGNVLILSSANEGTLLEAFDASLAPVWKTRLDYRALALRVDANGTAWVLDTNGALAFRAPGVSAARVALRKRPDMNLSAFGLVEDGIVFAWQHDFSNSMRSPVLERVQMDATVCWEARLPVGSIAYEGVVQMRADEGWKPRPKDAWMPETWVSTSTSLVLSGDAILASFSEMPRSGTGCGYVVSLADGSLQFVTKLGPIHEIAAFGSGEYLVGFQGYGAFETLLYAANGQVQARWPSHGRYVIYDRDIRVIEMENVLPSKMRLARLLPGGALTKGDLLNGYYTSTPHLRADGAYVFYRDGTLFAARETSISEHIMLCSPDESVYSTKIVADDRGMYFAYTRRSDNLFATSLVRVDF
jgi:hypothetical protein